MRPVRVRNGAAVVAVAAGTVAVAAAAAARVVVVAVAAATVVAAAGTKRQLHRKPLAARRTPLSRKRLFCLPHRQWFPIIFGAQLQQERSGSFRPFTRWWISGGAVCPA